ncbi:MAG: hypothetical protein GY729_10875 [Desulfobacteraceae bacterium]|nr:hypothetical protein [Desulfobacteraceae bacterium]
MGIIQSLKELGSDLFRLLILGILFYLLSLTPFGNWLKCNFFASDGCSPKFPFSIKQKDSLAWDTVKDKYKDETWQKGNPPGNTSESKCIYYTVQIKNLSYKGRGGLTLTWAPINTSNVSDTFLSRYRLKGKPANPSLPVKDSGYTKFKIQVVDLDPGKWYEREEAVIDLIIGIKNNIYIADQPNILFTLECEKCQISYQTKRM